MIGEYRVMKEIFKLENEHLSVRVASLGAELQSIYSKETEMEYMWQPGYEIWPHHSMLLFPNPGRIKGDRTVIGGKVYPATMHGFANDMEFYVLEKGQKNIVFEIKATEDTRRSFPYEFRLQVEFVLEDDMLYQKFRVVNDDKKPMYFSLGAHPGFYCPLAIGESGDDYQLVFDSPQWIDSLVLEENTRLVTNEKTPWLIGESKKDVGDHFFDKGPYLLKGVQAKYITLQSKKSGHFIEMGISGFPYLCLWGVPTRMSLICIEPWCGVSDFVDTDHIWETKKGIECVDVGKTFERMLSFRVG